MGNRRLILDEQEIIRLYIEENKSALQISKEMDCSVMAIFRRLWKNGIETKSQSEIMKGRKYSAEHRKHISEAVNRRDQTGANNPYWRGGRSYVKSANAIYPIVRIDGKYVKEHRYVMEQHLGRRLESSEHVHHIDGDKFNNHIDNLQLMTNSEHLHLHHQDPEYIRRKSETMKKRRAENPNWSTKKKGL